MSCMICGARANYYFAKQYEHGSYAHFMTDIGPVDYFRCVNCGFCFSKTHQELPSELWAKLNREFHTYTNSVTFAAKPTNSPPYAEQAFMLALAGRGG